MSSNAKDYPPAANRRTGGHGPGSKRSRCRTAGLGNSDPGPFTVGFKSSWRLDPSRVYNRVFDDKTTYASGKSPRPILINMWYPAEPAKNLEPMPHRGYLDIRSSEPQFSKLADELIGYEQDVVRWEVVRKRKQELTGGERQLLEGLWNAATAAYRNAPPVERRFPLVIYHSGGGSSFEDNAVLCEFLASHGYVVLGSAFQEPSGTSYNIDGRLGSARDMEYLIAYAFGLPDVDWKHIGIVGHAPAPGSAHVPGTGCLTGGCRGQPRYHSGLHGSLGPSLGRHDQAHSRESKQFEEALAFSRKFPCGLRIRGPID